MLSFFKKFRDFRDFRDFRNFENFENFAEIFVFLNHFFPFFSKILRFYFCFFLCTTMSDVKLSQESIPHVFIAQKFTQQRVKSILKPVSRNRACSKLFIFVCSIRTATENSPIRTASELT